MPRSQTLQLNLSVSERYFEINYILKDINLGKSVAVDQLLNYLKVGKNNTEFGSFIYFLLHAPS